MIDARESGVVYSSGIKDKDEMGIYTVSGLGDKLVSGEAHAREYFIDKKKAFDVSSGPAEIPESAL
jgi:pyruvate, water dikinase